MKILVIGSCVLDMVVNVDHLPDKTEDVNCDDVSLSLGGMAYNVYNIVSLFGCEAIFGCPIGKGTFADIVKNMLDERNIKPIYQINDMDNGVCMCFVDNDGERCFISRHQAEYLFDEKWFSNIDMNDVDIVYVSGLEVEDKNGEQLVSFLEKINKPVLFAIGPRLKHIPQSLIDRMYKLNCMLHLNEEEALLLANKDNIEDSADELFNRTHSPVIITLGDKGCYIKEENDQYYVEGIVANVVDTIGAGDSHAGSIIACLNQEVELKEAARIANIVASQVVQQKGANLSIKNFKKAVKKYHEINNIMLYQK